MFEHAIHPDRAAHPPAPMARHYGFASVGKSPTYHGGQVIRQVSYEGKLVTATLSDISADSAIRFEAEGMPAYLCMTLETVSQSRSGSGRAASIDGGRNSASISFIPSDTQFALPPHPTHYLRHLVLAFSPEGVQRAMSCTPGCFDDPRLDFADPQISQLGHMLAENCHKADAPSLVFCDNLCAAILSGFVRNVGQKDETGRGLSPWQLRKVTEYLTAHLTEAVRVETLASLCRLSRSHFCRGFKLATGVSPHQWQLNARVERAKLLMLSGPIALSQVTLDSGFADQSHFTRVFSTITGVPPMRWSNSRQ